MELLKIQVSFETEQAVANVGKFNAAQQQSKTETKNLDEAVTKAEQSVTELGTALDSTGKKVQATTEHLKQETRATKEAATATEQLGNAADQADDQIGKTQRALEGTTVAASSAAPKLQAVGASLGKVNQEGSRLPDKVNAPARELSGVVGPLPAVFQNMATHATSWVTGMLGIGGVVKLIQHLKQELSEVEEIRNRLLKSKLTTEETLRDFRANLGLPNTTQGQQQAFQTFKGLADKMPHVPSEVLMGVAGQTEAFYGPQGMGIRTKAGAGINEVLTNFAASAGASREVAEGLPQLAQIMGVKDERDAKQMIARLIAAQRSTGIASQNEFLGQFIRLAGQFKGFTFEDLAGTLSGATAAAPVSSPRLVGTAAEQVLAAIAGKNAEAQAALGRRAVSAGLIKPDEVKRAGEATRNAELAKHAPEIGRLERERLDSERSIELAEKQEKLDEQTDVDAIKKRPSQSRTIAARAVQRKEELAHRIEQQRQAISDRTQRIEEYRKAASKKADEQGYATAYRAVKPTEKLRLVRETVAKMTPEERNEFFTQELQATEKEERPALDAILSGAGVAMSEATATEVQKVGPREVKELDQSLKGYAESPLGRAQASRTRIQVQEFTAVTTEEEETQRLRDESKSRADIILKDWSDLREEQKLPFRGLWGDDLKIEMFQQDATRRIYEFWSQMSDEERAAHPEILRFAGAVQHAASSTTDEHSYANIEKVYRDFVRAARRLGAERSNGKYKTRTMSKPEPFYFKGQFIISPEAIGTRFRDTPISTIDEAAGGPLSPPEINAPLFEQSPPTTQPNGSRGEQPISYNTTNVHYGMIVVQPGGGLPLPGPFEGLG